MSEPIIPGEVLISRSDDYEPIPPPDYLGRMYKVGKYTLAYVVAITGYNVAQYIDTFYFDGRRDDIEMIEDAERCAPFSYVRVEAGSGRAIAPQGFTPKQAEETVTSEQEYSDVHSAVDNLEPDGLRPHKFIEQLLDINSHEFDSFTSSYSGADVHLYTDTDRPLFKVNREIIDELMHASLNESLTFDHITVSQFMECARDQILLSHGGSLLEGERVNLYIASTPGVCWSNGHIQNFPEDSDVSYREFCDSSGATMKDLSFDIIPGILSYEQTWIAVMTHNYDINMAEQHISKNLMHEPIHLWQQALGLPFKYHPNERLADFIEYQVKSQLYPDGFPVAVQYFQAVEEG